MKGLFHESPVSEFLNPIYLMVPSKGDHLKLSSNSVQLYSQIIEYENPDRVKIEGNEIYIDGEKIDSYTFKEDYYWFLSDNIIHSKDSRQLGFIPFSSVVGKIVCILYNSSIKNRMFEFVN